MSDFPRVVEVRALAPYLIFVRFDDGKHGTFDLEAVKGGLNGAFAPLRDPDEFAKVFIEPEWATLTWPCGVDLDPVVVHWWATGEPAWVADTMANPAQP